MDLWKLSTSILLFEQLSTVTKMKILILDFSPSWYNWQAFKHSAPPCVLTRRQLVRSF